MPYTSEETMRTVLILVVLSSMALLSVSSIFAAEVSVDPTPNANGNRHNGSSPTIVTISDDIAYVFYIDATGNAQAYQKTTDGGTTWGGTVTIDSASNYRRIAVWYDQWTPGDTGDIIHISSFDSTNDDMYYTQLDTTSDTLSATVNTTDAAATNQGGQIAPGVNINTITKGTDGTVYMAMQDDLDSYIIECSTACTTATNWSETGTNPLDLATDWPLLMPLPNDDVMVITMDRTANDYLSFVWDDSAGTWSGATTIDANAAENGTFDAPFSAVVDPQNGDLYLAYAAQINNYNSANDDIRTAIYSGGAWAAQTDVTTNDAKGITGVALGMDSSTGHVFAVYAAQTTLNDGTTIDIYARSSQDGMTTWSAETGPINTTQGTLYGPSIAMVSNERLMFRWVDDITDDLFVDDAQFNVTPPTYDQAAYRFFANTDSVDVGAPLAAQDTPATLPTTSNLFRLRSLLAVTNTGGLIGGAQTDLDAFSLEFVDRGTGTCAAPVGGTPATYTEVSTNTLIAYYDNPSATSGTALTANVNDPTDGGNTIVNQDYVESNVWTNSEAKILDGQDGKWDFALATNGAPASTTYCFRHTSTTTASTTYSQYPEITTPNFPPTASGVSIDSGATDVILTEATTTTVTCAGTVTDANGFADIASVTADLYRTSVGTSSALDDNDHYRLSGDTECVPSGGSGNSETYTCNFAVEYFADPTDAGSPFAAEEWTCLMTPVDSAATGTVATDTIEMASLRALDVTSPIDYGTLDPNTDSGATNATTTVTNTGNIDIDTQLSGVNMTSGANTIAVGQQQYANAAFTYGAGTALTTTPTTLTLTLPQQTGATSTDDIYWGIGIPNATPSGTYSGSNTITAI